MGRNGSSFAPPGMTGTILAANGFPEWLGLPPIAMR